MNKVLTIIIPTYNMERYLDKCLSSVIINDKKLMSQCEVLVIIDGAKDRSSEIAHGYQDKYPETYRVIDKENGNYGSCINRGLIEATGKYVKILDADDSFDNSLFAGYLQHLLSVDVDLVINDLTRINEKGRLIRNTHFNLPTDRIFGLEEFSKGITQLIGMHNVAYKTENLQKMNYKQSEGISYTDQEWIFNPFTNVKTIFYCRELLYRYLIGREGQTMQRDVMLRSANHQIQGAKKMLKDYEQFEKLDSLQQLFVDRKLTLRCFNIYYTYLSTELLPIEELKDFDNYMLRVSPAAYARLEDCSISYMIPFKFIKKWRIDGCTSRPSKFAFTAAMISNKFRSLKWRIFITIK